MGQNSQLWGGPILVPGWTPRVPRTPLKLSSLPCCPQGTTTEKNQNQNQVDLVQIDQLIKPGLVGLNL